MTACDRWPGCGCGTQSGPHTCEGREPITDEELRERLYLLQRWAEEMDDTIHTLQHQRSCLADSIKLLQDKLHDRSAPLSG